MNRSRKACTRVVQVGRKGLVHGIVQVGREGLVHGIVQVGRERLVHDIVQVGSLYTVGCRFG